MRQTVIMRAFLALALSARTAVAVEGAAARRLSSASQISTLAGNGGAGFDGDGVGLAHSLYGPAGVTVGANGALFIADTVSEWSQAKD